MSNLEVATGIIRPIARKKFTDCELKAVILNMAIATGWVSSDEILEIANEIMQNVAAGAVTPTTTNGNFVHTHGKDTPKYATHKPQWKE